MLINFLEHQSRFFMVCGRILDSLHLTHLNLSEGVSLCSWYLGPCSALKLCSILWQNLGHRQIDTGVVTKKMPGAYLPFRNMGALPCISYYEWLRHEGDGDSWFAQSFSPLTYLELSDGQGVRVWSVSKNHLSPMPWEAKEERSKSWLCFGIVSDHSA